MLRCFVAVLMTVASGVQDPPTKLSPDQARSHVGRTATICGRVGRVICPSSGKMVVIDLTDPSAPGPGAAIVLERSKLGTSLNPYLAQDVCANGIVELRDGRPAVVLNGLEQLQLTASADAARPRFGDGASHNCDDGIVSPSVVRDVKPAYPPAAQQARLEGAVQLEGVVLRNGAMGEIRVVRGLDARLDEEAIKAFKRWRFKPATRFGEPVSCVVTVELSFHLLR